MVEGKLLALALLIFPFHDGRNWNSDVGSKFLASTKGSSAAQIAYQATDVGNFLFDCYNEYSIRVLLARLLLSPVGSLLGYIFARMMKNEQKFCLYVIICCTCLAFGSALLMRIRRTFIVTTFLYYAY